MKKRLLLLKIIYVFLFFAHFSSAVAQNGGIANNWFFGHNAGLNFDTGSPVPISGPLNALEGVSTISDVNGNLLFSSDGISVFNRNNVQMPNGNNLWGNPSTTQSGVIVPNPANANQYYVFTAAAMAGIHGVCYSIVDMTLDGGLGDVLVKNIQLLTPAAEKITAIKNCNGTDFWMICHEWNSDAFYTYPITLLGIGTPVISHVGSVYQGNTLGTIGYLKSSPNGKRLASAIDWIPNNNVELFDFNTATGVISNPIYLPSNGAAYGVAFSPDNTKLYIGFEYMNPGLVQYDLTTTPISTHSMNLTYIHCALQLAPDGKIYFTVLGLVISINYLGVINNPNSAGAACNYNLNGVPNLIGSTTFGLPNFPDNFLAKPFSLGNDIVLCGDSAFFNAGVGWNSYSWSNGATTQSITTTTDGTYWVEVTDDCGNVITDTVKVSHLLPPFSLGRDTALCTATALTLDGGTGLSYSWSNGATTPSITVNTSGIYWVEKTDICGLEIDTINVSFTPLSGNLSASPILCQGDSTLLTAISIGGTAPYQYSLNNGQYQNAATFAVGQGVYSVSIQDQSGCFFVSPPLTLAEPPALNAILVGNTAVCHGATNHLNVNTTGGTPPYQYSLNGSPFQNLNDFVVGAGTYSATVQDANGCTFATDSLKMVENPEIIATISTTPILCHGDSSKITINASGGTPPLQYSLNGGIFQANNNFVVAAGTYAILVKDAKGCLFISNALNISTPPAISALLNIPPIPCHNETTNLTITASGGVAPYQYALNNGIYQNANTFSNLTGGNYLLNIRDANGCIYAHNLNIINPLPLIISVNADTACYNENTLLNVNAAGGTGILQFNIMGNPYQMQPFFHVPAGNYTINVQDSNHCAATTNINIPEYQDIHIQIVTIDSAYCNKANGSAIVLATGENQGFTYTWFTTPMQFGANLQQAAKGTYFVRAQDAKGCTKDTSVTIPQMQMPTAFFTSVPNASASLFENDSLYFSAQTSNAYNFSWNFGDGNESSLENPVHSFYNEGNFPVTLTAYDFYKECPATYTLTYNIANYWENFFIPNVFTPNADGFFDSWKTETNDYQKVSLKVFDRWGVRVFETNDLSQGWNGNNMKGKNCETGVYFYYLQIENFKGESREFKGNVSLIR